MHYAEKAEISVIFETLLHKYKNYDIMFRIKKLPEIRKGDNHVQNCQ